MPGARRALFPVGTSLVLHLGIAAAVARLAARPAPAAQQEALQIAVVERPPPPPPPPPPEPPPKPAPIKLARAPKAPPPPPTPTPLPPPVNAPPPPTAEAKTTTPEPVVITGITMESTAQGGSFAVGVGNTVRGTPDAKAHAPEEVKPYKAEQYAPAAQVTELPSPLNGDSLNLRKYYPAQARQNSFEGDVVLRLLIDADGSIAKVDVISDPGQGLGPAAARAVRELRFSSPKINGVPCATTLSFTIHFTLD
jgi:protein TonB